MIGGYLAQPASKFGPLKKPFFCKYPYSLPCIVGGTFAIISFIGKWFTLANFRARGALPAGPLKIGFSYAPLGFVFASPTPVELIFAPS